MHTTKIKTLKQLEEEHIRYVMSLYAGKKLEAWKDLGISRTGLYTKLKYYNIKHKRMTYEERLINFKKFRNGVDRLPGRTL